MARKSKKSSLQQRIDESGAREKSRYAKAKPPGGGDLPAGMRGVAKMTKLDFNEIEDGDYAGEQRCYFHGICVEPLEWKDKQGQVYKTEGALVQPCNVPLCDTESEYGDKTFEENVQKAENNLKLAGLPTEDFDDIETDALAFYEEFGEGEEGSIYFRFRTWSPEDSDRVIATITGPAPEDYEPPDPDDEIDEDEEEDEPPKRSKKSSKKSKASKSSKKKSSTSKTSKASKSSKKKSSKKSSEKVSEEELDELAEAAEEGDEEAEDKLVALAEEAGFDATEDEWKNWQMVVDEICERSEEEEGDDEEEGDEEEEEGDEEEDSEEPSKGDVVKYKPEGSKRAKKCEVTTVSKTKETVTLKEVSSGTVHKAVPWDDLEE